MTKDNHLIANELKNDPRINQAKALLQKAVADHKKKLTGVRAANPSLKKSYDEMVAAFNEERGGKLWYPYIGSGIGNGTLVELEDGSVKYDFICGIGPHYFGHSHPDMINASIDAALSDTVMQGHLQQNNDSVKLCKLLLNISKMDHCFLTTSGVMAVENALKIVWQKRNPASRILAFEKCFSGRTLAASQITDKPSFREGLPTVLHVDYVPFYDATAPEESLARSVAALKKHIARYPNQHALFSFELIQGEGGFHAGTTAYFEALMKICKEHHIAVLVDEIQSFGRTPQPFAYQYFKLDQYVDIVTIGKLSQVCATLYRAEYKPRPGLLSQTFTGSTSSIHAGTAIIETLLKDGYFGADGKITKIGAYFTQALQKLEQRHPGLIAGPYGIGTMVAFTPLGGDPQKVNTFAHALFDAGLIGFIAGSHPTRVRFLVPAGAITFEDIDSAIAIIEKTLLSS